MSIPKVHPTFRPLYETDKRYILITGGRGSLKSTSVHEFIIKLTYEEGHGILFTRYTMTSAEKSVIPEFKIVLERMGLADDFRITKNKVINKTNDSFILFSGIKTSSGNQTANLKSIAGITTFVVEEGEDFIDEDAFDTIDESVRSISAQNRVIWIQNPSTREHFIYKRWIENHSRQIPVQGFTVTVSNHPRVEHIHSTYHIAEQYLDKEWVAIAEEMKKRDAHLPQHQNRYYHKYIGGWKEKEEGVIYENWREGAYDFSLPYCYGLDLGFFPDPLALIKVAVSKKAKKIFVKEELYKQELSTEAIVDGFRSRLTKKKDLIVTDTNEPRLINDLRNKHGFHIINAKKGKGSVVDGIRDIQDYEIIVDPESYNIKKELNKYKWNDKKASIPIDDYNHSLDAMRYAFDKLAGRKRGFTLKKL